MKMKPLLFVVIGFATAASLLAQQGPGGGGGGGGGRGGRNQNQGARFQPFQRTFWKAELPGGEFLVAHSTIREVSRQQYIVDGAARVTEVNIDTGGSFKPRFYYLEPIAAEGASAIPAGGEAAQRAQDQAQAMATRLSPGDPAWSKVVKNYPATTHAGTIEFRLESLDQLTALFESIERSWTSGKSETYTPEGVKAYTPPQSNPNSNVNGTNTSTDGANGN